MSSREFAEWVAYDRINPIGPERADWRAALIAWMIACAFRGKGRPPAIKDFMPEWDVQPKTAKEIELLLTDYAKKHNEAVKHKQKRGR